MTSLLTSVLLLSVIGDPLAGIVAGGSTGLVAAGVVAALLGMALNGLGQWSQRDRQSHTHVGPPAAGDFRQAA